MDARTPAPARGTAVARDVARLASLPRPIAALSAGAPAADVRAGAGDARACADDGRTAHRAGHTLRAVHRPDSDDRVALPAEAHWFLFSSPWTREKARASVRRCWRRRCR